MSVTASRQSLEPGHELHWYTIERVLGQGGFGITYLATDNNLKKKVAIKEFYPPEIAVRLDDLSIGAKTPELTADYERWRERFMEEARTLAQFDHPNIIRCYSVFESHNTACMVMRYEQGEALGSILQRKGTLEEQELLEIMQPVLEGLGNVHAAGFVHRDCQPSNIYIREDTSPVLLDFGSAREASGPSQTLTILVAPGYAPFEQYYSRSDEQGPWTDIYGLGATLYRAVTGEAPIDAIERSRGLLGNTRDMLLPAKVAGDGRYSKAFLEAIDHALEFEPKARPQSVAQWSRELKGEALPTPSPSTPATVAPTREQFQAEPAPAKKQDQTAERSSWLVPVAIALGIFLGAGLTALLLQQNQPEVAPSHTADPSISPGTDIASRIAASSTTDPVVDIQASDTTTELQIPEPKTEPDAEPQVAEPPAEPPTASVETEQAAVEAPPDEINAKTEKELQTLKAELARQDADRQKLEDELAKLRAEKREPAATQPQPQPVKTPAVLPEETPAMETPPDPIAPVRALLASGQWEQAARDLQPLADSGHVLAQYELARLYRDGRGVLANNRKALHWILHAARQGHVPAQMQIARWYTQGIDGVRDDFLAYTWFLVAERLGAFQLTQERNLAEEKIQAEQMAQASELAAAIIAAIPVEETAP